MDSRIRLALEFIKGHCGEPLTVSRVGEQVGLSRSRFQHVFRRETGATFRECLRETRLAKACALLASRRLRVKEVSAQCGYARACDLTRAFEARFGLSPSQYRDGTICK